MLESSGLNCTLVISPSMSPCQGSATAIFTAPAGCISRMFPRASMASASAKHETLAHPGRDKVGRIRLAASSSRATVSPHEGSTLGAVIKNHRRSRHPP